MIPEHARDVLQDDASSLGASRPGLAAGDAEPRLTAQHLVLARVSPPLRQGAEPATPGRLTPADDRRREAGAQHGLHGSAHDHEGRGAVVTLAHDYLALLVATDPSVIPQDVRQRGRAREGRRIHVPERRDSEQPLHSRVRHVLAERDTPTPRAIRCEGDGAHLRRRSLDGPSACRCT